MNVTLDERSRHAGRGASVRPGDDVVAEVGVAAAERVGGEDGFTHIRGVGRDIDQGLALEL